MSTLNEAIAEAAETLTARIDPLGTKKGEVVEETPTKEDDEQPAEESDEEPEESDASANDKVDDEDLDEISTKEAKALYKALSGPQGKAVLEVLATQAGLMGKNLPETPAETRAAKKAVSEIIMEKLPDNMKFLAKELGPAIEAVFEQEREEQNEKFQQIELQKVEQQVVEATKRLDVKTKGGYTKYEKQIRQLVEEMPPGPNMSIDKYLKNLYLIASSGTSNKSNTRQIADKIRSNASDAPSRLRTSAQTGPNSGVPQMPDKKMSSKEAVRWALANLPK